MIAEISVTNSYHTICLGIEIVGYAERSTDLVLSSVTFSDVSSVVKLTVIIFGKLCVHLLCALVELFG